MIEKLQKIQSNKGVFAPGFTDVSSAYSSFDCIPHELPIGKLNAYRFDTKSLNFTLSYFTNQNQKRKIAFGFSDVLSILFDVQDSVFRPLVFIIYKYDLYMEYDTIEFDSFADDTVCYTFGQNL